jgi:hypothetical protein
MGFDDLVLTADIELLRTALRGRSRSFGVRLYLMPR